MDRWRRMVRAQGGDPDAPLPAAAHVEEIRAKTGGTVAAVDALAVGVAAVRLGAGRVRKEDPVSPSAGIVLRVTPGASVAAGQVLAELHADDAAHMDAGRSAFAEAIRWGEAPASPRSRILERVTGP
jgi:thymidine phosphorylase